MNLFGHDVYAYSYGGDANEAKLVWEEVRDLGLVNASVWRTTNTERSQWLVVVVEPEGGELRTRVDFRAGVEYALNESEANAFLNRRLGLTLDAILNGKTEVMQVARMPLGARLGKDGSLTALVGGDGPREATDVL